MDDGNQRVEDAAERAELKRQAMKVHLETITTMIVLGAALYFLPI
jgi:hypothetical protein